jgi:membrane protease YdiL (CAAX protease family)
VTARGLWGRLGLGAAFAALLAFTLSPPLPNARLAPTAGFAVGLAAGTALFACAVRRFPRIALRPFLLVLGVVATSEEVVWRRVALGELLPAGVVVALVASSVGFALVHPRRRLLHLATGASFGGVYLCTGTLAASIGAHWVYNACVGSLVGRKPP